MDDSVLKSLQGSILREGLGDQQICGKNQHFVVIVEQHGFCKRVEELVAEAGCVISHRQERVYRVPSRIGPESHGYRHYDPWNHGASIVEEEPEPVTDRIAEIADRANAYALSLCANDPKPVMLPELVAPQAAVSAQTIIDPEYLRRVETFLLEIRAVVIQRQLDPEDFRVILEEAEHMVAVEDPVQGPHAGLITALQTVLKTRAILQSASSSISNTSA